MADITPNRLNLHDFAVERGVVAFDFPLHLFISFILGCMKPGGGGVLEWFLTGCAARGLKPLPISMDFSPSNNGWFNGFFEIFANRDPFLRVFLHQKGLILPFFFFAIFVKWDPLLRIFLTKMGPMSKDFCWKSNPFGRHIPVCLNMWVPPPVWNSPNVIFHSFCDVMSHLWLGQKKKKEGCVALKWNFWIFGSVGRTIVSFF